MNHYKRAERLVKARSNYMVASANVFLISHLLLLTLSVRFNVGFSVDATFFFFKR